MSRKMHLLTLIMAGLRNRPGRNLASIFCFAFIAANIFSAQYLMAGAVGNVDRGLSRMGADVMVVPAQYAVLFKGAQMGPVTANGIVRVEPSTLRFNNEILGTIAKVPGIAAMSPQLFVSTQNIPELASSPVDIYGIDPSTDFTIRPWLNRPLKSMGSGEVIAGSDIAGDVYSQILIRGQQYTIAGKLDPSRSAIDHSIFLGMNDAYQIAAAEEGTSPSASPLVPGSINAVLVKAAPDADPEMVGARIQQPFSYSYAKVIGRNFALEPVSQEIQRLPYLLNLISLIVIFASLPLIALIAAMVAHERQREIGLFRAMGAKRKTIFTLVIAESVVLSIMGGCIGVGIILIVFNLGLISVFFGTNLTGLIQIPDPGLTIRMAGLAIGTVITIGTIPALWPAYRSCTMNVYDAIREESR